jgi:hypothetical protein
MIRSKYLTIIAITIMAVINTIATVSCNNIATIVKTAKEQIASFTETQISSFNIGIVKGIYVGPQTPYNPFGDNWRDERHYFFVLVKPTNAEANKTYIVSLYVDGQLRQKNYISWNQPELNVATEKYVRFDLITEEEWNAYSQSYFLPPSTSNPQEILSYIQMNYPTKSLPSSICNATITSEESYLPNNNKLQPDLNLEHLSIKPQQASVNETVVITIWQINESTEKGNTVIDLKINGQLEQSKTVDNCPRQYNPMGCRVVFTVSKSQPGTYNVDIGGQKGTFTIE